MDILHYLFINNRYVLLHVVFGKCVCYDCLRVFFFQRTVDIEVSLRIGSGLQRNCAVGGTHMTYSFCRTWDVEMLGCLQDSMVVSGSPKRW